MVDRRCGLVVSLGKLGLEASWAAAMPGLAAIWAAAMPALPVRPARPARRARP